MEKHRHSFCLECLVIFFLTLKNMCLCPKLRQYIKRKRKMINGIKSLKITNKQKQAGMACYTFSLNSKFFTADFFFFLLQFVSYRSNQTRINQTIINPCAVIDNSCQIYRFNDAHVDFQNRIRALIAMYACAIREEFSNLSDAQRAAARTQRRGFFFSFLFSASVSVCGMRPGPPWISTAGV